MAAADVFVWGWLSSPRQLNGQGMHTIEAGTFGELPRLQYLELHHNRLTRMPGGRWQTKRLSAVGLISNNISEVAHNFTFPAQTEDADIVKLEDNPLFCRFELSNDNLRIKVDYSTITCSLGLKKLVMPRGGIKCLLPSVIRDRFYAKLQTNSPWSLEPAAGVLHTAYTPDVVYEFPKDGNFEQLLSKAIDVGVASSTGGTNVIPERNVTRLACHVEWTPPADCQDPGKIDVGKTGCQVYAHPKCVGNYTVTLSAEDSAFPGSAYGKHNHLFLFFA